MQRRIVWVLAVGLALAALAAVGTAVGWHDVMTARSHLVAARHTLEGAVGNPNLLRSPEGRVQARRRIDQALGEIGTAQAALRGSVPLTVSRVLPFLSRQRGGAAQLVDDSRTGALAARHLLDEVDRLGSRTRLDEGRIPIEGLKELEGAVRAAGDQVGALRRSSSGLWFSLHAARSQFDRIATDSSTRLLRAAEALRASQSFLGGAGDRRYLVAVQNNAEMRDQGAVLSYAIVRVSDRQLVVEKHGSINELTLKQASPTPIPPGTDLVFGSLRPTTQWPSVNATADFAWSGRAMADMFRSATGQSVDGVIAVDVPGLTPLLRAVGPLKVDGVDKPVTAANAGKLLLHDLYEGVPANPTIQVESDRQKILSNVAAAVVDRLHHGTFDVVGLGRDLSREVAGGHMRLWSAIASEEASFEKVGLGGSPAAIDPKRTFHLAVENRTATKLDYYVRPAVTERVEITDKGSAIVRTTVVVDNPAPVNAKPNYQLGPDPFGTTKKPGDYIAWVLLWSPAGITPPASVSESGLALNQSIVRLSAGERKTVTFETVIPRAVQDGRLALRFVPQPRLQDPTLAVTLVAPGWHVEGAKTWRGNWDRARTFSWKLGR